MMRQLAQFVANLLVKPRLQHLADPFMQKLSTFDQQRVVGDLLGQRVLEDVTVLGQPQLFIDELGAL